MSDVGRLLFPALRWKDGTGFGHEEERIAQALELGVGGFIVFGGDVASVRALTARLHSASEHPLLIGADLERGAGQQFAGATSLPPAAAFGWIGDVDLTRRAGELTAREARALGVNWVYAPVADVDLEPANPIVGTRAFGTRSDDVADHVAAWVEGCRAGGALACAKHFPGHGRTTADSHLELPTVFVSRAELEDDLLPFRRAIDAGAGSVMTAHVAYPALDPSGLPATLSRPIVHDLLRRELGFDGIVVTDALIMEGVLEAGGGAEHASVRALLAGCDALLYPDDPQAVVDAILRAVGRELRPDVVAKAIDRIDAAARRYPPARGDDGAWRSDIARSGDVAWADDVARRAVHPVRGQPGGVSREVELLTVDDDVGGPFPPPPRGGFAAALASHGFELREVEHATGERPLIVAVYADIRGWKGRPGISRVASERIRAAIEARPDAIVALFGHPRLAEGLPGRHVLAAWGGEPVMQRAVAAWLAEA